MKQNLKLILLLFILATIHSCQRDDELLKQHEHGEIIPSPKSEISFENFLNRIESNYQKSEIKILDKYRFGHHTTRNSKNTNDSIIHYIDTTTIVAFELDYVQSYTFNAVPISDTLNVLYNIIFYQNNYGLESKLLKYEPDFDFVNNSLPFSGIIHEIDAFGNILNTYTNSDNNSGDLNKNMTPCAFSISTVNVTCTGHDQNGDPQNHTSSPPCTCGQNGSQCSPPYSYNILDIDCNTGSAGGGSSDPDNYPNDNPDNPSGGGGNDNTNPNQNDDGTFNLPTDPVKPVKITDEDFGKRKEHQKIKNLLDSNPTYLNKIQNLATKVQENKEYSLSIHEDGSENEEVGIVGSGGIDLPNYASPYVFYAHIHDSFGKDGLGTLSVFSMSDLSSFAKIAYFDKLNSDTFVAFLATADGTKYALTINDRQKLIDVFISDFDLDITIDNMFQIDASSQIFDKLFKKYFRPSNTNRKLKVDSNDNETDLLEFLNFINEGDIGVTLFETKDNFQTFKHVSVKNNQVVRKEFN